jgi:hypothetical protein
MASFAKRLKADSATAADAPRPVGSEDVRLEALRHVYASISSREELKALLNEDVQQCVITGNYKLHRLCPLPIRKTFKNVFISAISSNLKDFYSKSIV